VFTDFENRDELGKVDGQLEKVENNLNWLNRTTGRKFKMLYFWLLTAFDVGLCG
jgi:hypothetical protein